MTNKPCEYCGMCLPEGVDKKTRRVRTLHFLHCEIRLGRIAGLQSNTPRDPVQIALDAARALKDALSAEMLDEIGLWSEWSALQDALDALPDAPR